MKKVVIISVLLLLLIPSSVNAFSVSQITSHKDVCLSDNDFDFSLYVRQETGKTQYMKYEHDNNIEIFELPTETSNEVVEHIEIPNEEGIYTNYFLFSFYGGYVEGNDTLTSNDLLNTDVKNFDALGFAFPNDFEMKDIDANVTLTEISNKYDIVVDKATEKYSDELLNTVLVDNESNYKFKFYDIGGLNPRVYFNIHYNETNEPIHIWAYNSDEIHSARYGATSRSVTKIKSKLELNVTDCSATNNKDERDDEENQEDNIDNNEDSSDDGGSNGSDIDYDNEDSDDTTEQNDTIENETINETIDNKTIQNNTNTIENKTFRINTTDNQTNPSNVDSGLMWRFWIAVGGFIVFVLVCIFMIVHNEKRVSI